MKIKSVTVTPAVASLGPDSMTFRVTKAQDQIEYLPGAVIKRDDLQSLCNKRDWKVTIIPTP